MTEIPAHILERAIEAKKKAEKSRATFQKDQDLPEGKKSDNQSADDVSVEAILELVNRQYEGRIERLEIRLGNAEAEIKALKTPWKKWFSL